MKIHRQLHHYLCALASQAEEMKVHCLYQKHLFCYDMYVGKVTADVTASLPSDLWWVYSLVPRLEEEEEEKGLVSAVHGCT